MKTKSPTPHDPRLDKLIRLARVNDGLQLQDAMQFLGADEAEAANLLDELTRRGALAFEPQWQWDWPDFKSLYRVRPQVNAGDDEPDFAIETEQLTTLRELSERLYVLERRLQSEAQTLDTECRQRIAGSDGWWSDFNIGYTVQCFLKESDPEYDVDGDNELVELNGRLRSLKRTQGILDEDLDFNDLAPDHPLAGEHHCGLFHELYAHSELDWTDLLRIGHIDADIKARFVHSSRPKNLSLTTAQSAPQ